MSEPDRATADHRGGADQAAQRHERAGADAVDVPSDPEAERPCHDLRDGEGAEDLGQRPALIDRDGAGGDRERVEQRTPTGDLGPAQDRHLTAEAAADEPVAASRPRVDDSGGTAQEQPEPDDEAGVVWPVDEVRWSSARGSATAVGRSSRRRRPRRTALTLRRPRCRAARARRGRPTRSHRRSRRRRCGSARTRSGSGTTARGRRTSCRRGRGRPRAGAAGSAPCGETEPQEWYAGWISGARATGADSSPSRSRWTSESQVWSGRNPVTTTTSSTSAHLLARRPTRASSSRPARAVDARGAEAGHRGNWAVGDDVLGGRCAERAALLELVVVAASEGVLGVVAADQPAHAGAPGGVRRAGPG